ncbi:glycosyltransferase [Pedobacter sp. B4-66]|uniref:glycosyltransferase n=1 Tax=Pedobacter sp. B4-66 TaxID=2817280 RepID=UPI001BD9AEEE|nr:glycosyltransferase [Pedobacter sp. B4-66]
MKKKVFFIITSLQGGGSERVFWLLSQGFNKELYNVCVIILDSSNGCFSTEITGVKFIDLGTVRASRSFWKLYKLIKNEKPFAVFSTTDHINMLVSFVSIFVKIPNLIARASNNPHQMKQFEGLKTRFWRLFTRVSYKNYDRIVCQTDEMKKSVLAEYNLNPNQLVVIHNPLIYSDLVKGERSLNGQKKLLIIARMSKEKGFERLLDIFSQLPETYTLSIAGDGVLKNKIVEQVNVLNLQSRVTFLGNVNNVTSIICKHDVLLLGSFTEGFPNVVLESLSVGLPVVSFRVGGISDLIKDGFNGYIIEQGDLKDFKNQIITACNKPWDFSAIKNDVYNKYALDKVAAEYEYLINNI